MSRTNSVGDGSTPKLLAECAVLINNYGPESAQVDDFIRKHSDNVEFVELAKLSKTLKKALDIKYKDKGGTAARHGE